MFSSSIAAMEDTRPSSATNGDDSSPATIDTINTKYSSILADNDDEEVFLRMGATGTSATSTTSRSQSPTQSPTQSYQTKRPLSQDDSYELSHAKSTKKSNTTSGEAPSPTLVDLTADGTSSEVATVESLSTLGDDDDDENDDDEDESRDTPTRSLSVEAVEKACASPSSNAATAASSASSASSSASSTSSSSSSSNASILIRVREPPCLKYRTRNALITRVRQPPPAAAPPPPNVVLTYDETRIPRQRPHVPPNRSFYRFLYHHHHHHPRHSTAETQTNPVAVAPVPEPTHSSIIDHDYPIDEPIEYCYLQQHDRGTQVTPPATEPEQQAKSSNEANNATTEATPPPTISPTVLNSTLNVSAPPFYMPNQQASNSTEPRLPFGMAPQQQHHSVSHMIHQRAHPLFPSSNPPLHHHLNPHRASTLPNFHGSASNTPSPFALAQSHPHFHRYTTSRAQPNRSMPTHLHTDGNNNTTSNRVMVPSPFMPTEEASNGPQAPFQPNRPTQQTPTRLHPYYQRLWIEQQNHVEQNRRMDARMMQLRRQEELMRSMENNFHPGGAFLALPGMQATFSISANGEAQPSAAGAGAGSTATTTTTTTTTHEFSLHDIPHMQISITPTHVGITSTAQTPAGAQNGEQGPNGGGMPAGAAISALGAAISSLPAAILVAHHSPNAGAVPGGYVPPNLPPVSISAGPVSVYGSIAHSPLARTFLDQRLRFPRLYFWDRNIEVSFLLKGFLIELF